MYQEEKPSRGLRHMRRPEISEVRRPEEIVRRSAGGDALAEEVHEAPRPEGVCGWPDFLGLYLTQGQTNVFFRSAPTARSPRAATHDSRLAEKFVDFEEL